MPCVKVIEEFAFDVCCALADVECDKLERIEGMHSLTASL
jgi:hypothetical protein